MSTRHLYVILFVLLFTVTVISYLLLRDVLLGLQVAEELLFLSARRGAYIITTFHSLLTLKRYNRFFKKLPLRVTQQKGNKDIKSLNAHNSVTIRPTELADPSLESSFHAVSDGQCVVSG